MTLIANWISNFDPARIDDCFGGGKNAMPRELQKLLDRPGEAMFSLQSDIQKISKNTIKFEKEEQTMVIMEKT